MMFVGCIVLWAAAVTFGQFVDATVSADVFGLAVAAAVVLAAVTVYNAVLLMWLNCLLLLHRLLWC